MSLTQLPRPWLAALVALVVGVAGLLWWLDDEDSVAPPDWSALPVVAPVVPAAADDVPDDVAAAALAQLDPCALATIVRGRDDDQHLALDLWTCRSEGARGQLVAAVELDAAGLADQLRSAERVSLRGRAAWRLKGADGCEIDVPVGIRAGLRFSASPELGCRALTRHVDRVLAALDQDPHAFDLATSRPTACQLITDADLGKLLPGCEDDDRRKVEIHFAEELPWDDDRAIRVAGADAAESRSRATELPGPDLATCSVRWTTDWRQPTLAGTAGLGRGEDPLAVTVLAENCRVARRIAARLVPVARDWRPPPPPSPLPFHRYDATADLTGTGACRFLEAQDVRLCAPAVEREVPKDPVDFVRHSEADPDVLCTVALELAREHDPELVAASALRRYDDEGDPRSCVLVHPASGLEIELIASREPLRGDDPAAEIGGHAAHHDPDPGTWEVAFGGPEERGSLTIDVSHGSEADWFDDFVEELVRRVL